MLEWMSAINAHIHIRYVAEWNIRSDYWERGNIATSFWKVSKRCIVVVTVIVVVYVW